MYAKSSIQFKYRTHFLKKECQKVKMQIKGTNKCLKNEIPLKRSE